MEGADPISTISTVSLAELDFGIYSAQVVTSADIEPTLDMESFAEFALSASAPSDLSVQDSSECGKKPKKTKTKKAPKVRNYRPTWLAAEKEQLLSAIKGNPVLDENLTPPDARGHNNEQKIAAWKVIAERVNVVGGHNRTWAECRLKRTKWFSKIKTKIADNKRHSLKTGNGGPPPHRFTNEEEVVESLIPKLKVEGIENAPKTKWMKSSTNTESTCTPKGLLNIMSRSPSELSEEGLPAPTSQPIATCPKDAVKFVPAPTPVTDDVAGKQEQIPAVHNLSQVSSHVARPTEVSFIAASDKKGKPVGAATAIPGYPMNNSRSISRTERLEANIEEMKRSQSVMRENLTSIICAYENHQSTLELVSTLMGNILSSLAVLNENLNPAPPVVPGHAPMDYMALGAKLKDSMYKEAAELDLPIDENRQPLRTVRVSNTILPKEPVTQISEQ